MIIYILYYLVFKILSSLVRDSSYHDMYYKRCGLLCAHKKSFNTAIPVRSLGPYMYVHYCTCIVHILVWTYLFLSTSFFDCLSFCGLFLKHPFQKFFPFYILYFYLSRSLSLSISHYLSTHSISLHTPYLYLYTHTHTHSLSLSFYALSISLYTPYLSLYTLPLTIFTRTLYFSTHSPFLFLSTHSLSLSTHTHTHSLSVFRPHFRFFNDSCWNICFFVYNVKLKVSRGFTVTLSSL